MNVFVLSSQTLNHLTWSTHELYLQINTKNISSPILRFDWIPLLFSIFISSVRFLMFFLSLLLGNHSKTSGWLSGSIVFDAKEQSAWLRSAKVTPSQYAFQLVYWTVGGQRAGHCGIAVDRRWVSKIFNRERKWNRFTFNGRTYWEWSS